MNFSCPQHHPRLGQSAPDSLYLTCVTLNTSFRDLKGNHSCAVPIEGNATCIPWQPQRKILIFLFKLSIIVIGISFSSCGHRIIGSVPSWFIQSLNFAVSDSCPAPYSSLPFWIWISQGPARSTSVYSLYGKSQVIHSQYRGHNTAAKPIIKRTNRIIIEMLNELVMIKDEVCYYEWNMVLGQCCLNLSSLVINPICSIQPGIPALICAVSSLLSRFSRAALAIVSSICALSQDFFPPLFSVPLSFTYVFLLGLELLLNFVNLHKPLVYGVGFLGCLFHFLPNCTFWCNSVMQVFFPHGTLYCTCSSCSS